MEPNISDCTIPEKTQPENTENPSMVIQKTNRKTDVGDWREKYYKSIIGSDEKKIECEMFMMKIKSYKLLLQSIELEKKMGELIILIVSPNYFNNKKCIQIVKN